MRATFSGLIVLLFLLHASQEGALKTEAKMCTSPSRFFRGLCFVDRNCLAACERDGFSAGECEGARRRCICSKPC